ncbi:DUF2924 domain-containing protein [Erythrobacter arachoides]|uniref:DUF2924 domain-containing protein n=1 Tax=Aurantiacibacter arachoides TaxID=1850444 RepID=A0A845A3D5_9SPHN|nr:DUF2924 domain-containing protein [Aurantiacibacter arachoides]MXO93932.1 DUF2924 domain-containing protein [Aurantiacibacter arachoides]GGD45505.1 hypothetical protein GCM10011411_01360 [Aurantiacibacter arachoides]
MSGVAVDAQVEALEAMDLEELRDRWRQLWGAPPPLRSAPILRLLLAWRIQSSALGGLDAETRRLLSRSGPVEPEGQHLGNGAVLTRHWQGREVRVIVEDEGFRWEGQLFASLSAAASAIAGSRWNGPRFFGLRRS